MLVLVLVQMWWLSVVSTEIRFDLGLILVVAGEGHARGRWGVTVAKGRGPWSRAGGYITMMGQVSSGGGTEGEGWVAGRGVEGARTTGEGGGGCGVGTCEGGRRKRRWWRVPSRTVPSGKHLDRSGSRTRRNRCKRVRISI